MGIFVKLLGRLNIDIFVNALSYYLEYIAQIPVDFLLEQCCV
jgi:hypothetical protein